MRTKKDLIQDLSQFVSGLKEDINEEFNEESTPFLSQINAGEELVDYAENELEDLCNDKNDLLDYLERVLNEIYLL